MTRLLEPLADWGKPAVMTLACGSAAASAFVLARTVARRIQYLGPNESLLVKRLTEKVVIPGPAVCFPNPLTTLKFEKLKDIVIQELQYVVVLDEATGAEKLVQGPTMMRLGPYEKVLRQGAAIPLSASEYVHVRDQHSGDARVEHGPQSFTPGLLDEVLGKPKQAVALQANQYVRLEDSKTGKLWVERGPNLLIPEPSWVIREGPDEAYTLKQNQYIRLSDKSTATCGWCTGRHWSSRRRTRTCWTTWRSQQRSSRSGSTASWRTVLRGQCGWRLGRE